MTLRSKLLAVAVLCGLNALGSPAIAQSGCTGQFASGTLCTNSGASLGLPGPSNNILLGTATGGKQGAGTLNAQGLFVNGAAVSTGGASIAPSTTNNLAYYTGTSAIGGLATGNNGILATNGSGVPSITSTLPTLVQNNISLSNLLYTNAVTGGSQISQQTYNQERVSITDFGAVADSTTGHATVNYNAILNAVTTLKHVIVPYASAGYNIGTNVVTMPEGSSLECESNTVIYGQGTSIFLIPGSATAAPSPYTDGFPGCVFNTNGASGGSSAVTLKTATVQVNYVKLHNFRCINTYACINDQNATGYDFIKINDIESFQSLGGPQFNLSQGGGGGNIYIGNLTCEFVNGYSSLVSWGCGNFNNITGLYQNGLWIATGVGSGTPSYNSAVTAWKINSEAVWFNGVIFADGTVGNGIDVTGTAYMWGPGMLEGSLNLGTQVAVHDITTQAGQFPNIVAYGAIGATGAAATTPGVVISNIVDGTFPSIWVTNATGDGLDIENTNTGLSIGNLTSFGNAGNWATTSDILNGLTISGGYNASNGGGLVQNATNVGQICINGVIGITPMNCANSLNGKFFNVLSNPSTGTSATTGYESLNSNSQGSAIFGIGGSGYTGIAILQNRGFVDCGTGTGGCVINNEGATPTIFGISNAEVGRWSGSTAGLFQIGLANTTLGQLALYGNTSGVVTQTVQAAAGTPTITWGTSSGTPAVTASSPLAITTATGNITCSTCLATSSLGTGVLTALGDAVNTTGGFPTYTVNTWTPAVTASSTAGTPAYSVQVGSYEQIGRQVTVRFTITLSGWTGTPSGNVTIIGLPVASANTTNDNGVCHISNYTVSGLASLNYGITGEITPNTSVINLYQNGNTGTTTVTAAQTGTTPTLTGMCNYHT